MGNDQQWHEIAVGNLFTFSSPVALEPAATQGIDSAVGEWHGPNLLVRSDYGPFSDPLTSQRTAPNRQAFEETIDGRPARIVSFDEADGSRFTAVHVAGPGGAPAGKLTLVVISRGERSADEALRMLRSVRFRR